MESLPPLPKISGDLMLDVFTHKSLQVEAHNHEYGGNDRLAELGGKVLDMVITHCLFLRRPMLMAADIEKQREELLSERNIENWMSAYKLRGKWRCHPSVAEDLKTPEESRFLLNSYIGAIYVENGLPAIQEWASRLLNPELSSSSSPPPDSHAHNQSQMFGSPQPPSATPPPLPMNQQPPPPAMGSVAILNQTATQRGVTVSYEASSVGPSHQPTWTVKCIMNGSEMGRGVGKSQKIAKEEAARQAYSAVGWVAR